MKVSKKERIVSASLKFAVSISFSALLYGVGQTIGKVFYTSQVQQFREFSLQRVIDMNLTGLLHDDYGTYAVIYLALLFLSVTTALGGVIRYIKNVICVNTKVCIHCPKYLNCKRVVKVERTY